MLFLDGCKFILMYEYVIKKCVYLIDNFIYFGVVESF